MRERQRELLELLERSGADLFALLTRLTLCQDTAEELMQELFLKLSSRKAPKNIANWDAYAYRSAVNLAFDWRRRCRKRETLKREQTNSSVGNVDSPLKQLVHSEQLQETLDAIEKLNKNSRQIITMRYIQQASYETIAEQTGRTPHQVRALCHKAISHLRELLADKSYERMEENAETK